MDQMMGLSRVQPNSHHPCNQITPYGLLVAVGMIMRMISLLFKQDNMGLHQCPVPICPCCAYTGVADCLHPDIAARTCVGTTLF